MDPSSLLAVLHRAVDAVVDTLSGHDDWGLSGGRAGQYSSDLAADAAAVTVLRGEGLTVVSEETGRTDGGEVGGDIVVVLDPLDGSTNASLGLPWYATSICAVDDDGPLAAVVHDLPGGTRLDAVRGRGARRDGVELSPRGPGPALGNAIVAVNALPPRSPGWGQFRSMGAAALDLCAVATGRFDAYVDYDTDALGPWDYLGGMLICREVGIEVVDAFDRELVTLGHDDRRTPVAAPSALLEPLLTARRRAATER